MNGKDAERPLRHAPILLPVRLLVRAGRASKNRVLHPLRRMRARNRLSRMPGVRRVLVVCLGNICRSPYGAARLAGLEMRGETGEIRSAGFIGPGRPSPDNARSAAKKRGLDLESHVSQLLDPDLVAWADLLVVMEPGQGRALRKDYGASPEGILVLGDLDPGSPATRSIRDPYGQDEAFFMKTYARMDRCLEELARLISGGT